MKGGPGFRSGASSLWYGFRFLLGSPRSWPYAIIPALVLMALVTICVAISVTVIRSWAAGWIDSGSGSTWAVWAGAAVGWLVAIIAGVIGLLISLALASPISAPALEKLVLHVEEKIDAPPRAESSFFKEMWFGLKAQVFAFAVAIPLLLLLWIIDLVFPPAVVVTLPLKLLVAAFSLSWNLLDYPLTLHGVRMRDRLRLFRAHKRATLAFGIGFAILFWLPCFQVLMLPVGVVAGTRLVWWLLEASPELAQAWGLAPAPSASHELAEGQAVVPQLPDQVSQGPSG